MTRILALWGGLVFSGLLFTTTAQAADISTVEEPLGLAWYVGLFGGHKWGNGEIDVTSFREECVVIVCDSFEGELHGEVENGWIFGGVLGAQLQQHIRAEIEVSHARLDTETTAAETDVFSILGIPVSSDTFTARDEDHLSETFILANAWFSGSLTPWLSPYIGGGAGVAHVSGEFGVGSFGDPANPFSASIDADDWAFAWQIGAGLLFSLSDHLAIDLGYRFKTISSINLNGPVFCGADDCDPAVEQFTADDHFGVHEHVAQVGITLGF